MGKDVRQATYQYDDEAPPRDRRASSANATRLVRLSLLPISVILWLIGVAETDTTTLGPYGLITRLPAIFYAGLILLIVSAGIELSRSKVSQLRLGLHSGILAIILYGTPALVYAEGRYSWLYKTIGVVQYVKVNGHLNTSIDIYQRWPGFFALAAWFDRVAGVSSPLAYAKWSQVVFELAALPLLYSIYTSLSLPVRHRWLGLMLYSAGNWISQDYLSPQALSTVLSLGIMAMTLRWMVAGNAPGNLTRDDQDLPKTQRGRRPGPAQLRLRGALPFIAALLILLFVLVFSHELSPYMVIIQLIALAAVGQMRPRWIPLAGLVVTIGYLVPNFSYVNSHFGLLSSFGHFFSNIQSPSASTPGTTPRSQRIIGYCADLLSVGVWGLSLIGAWFQRRSRRTVIALLCLTFSPVLVLVGGAYGNEGILRVYLFSLPWAAALAAFALLPVPRLVGSPAVDDAVVDDVAVNRTAADATRRRRLAVTRVDMRLTRADMPAVGGDVRAKRGILARISHSRLSPTVALTCAVALFFPAFYGNDSSNVMPASQVKAVTSFLESAKPGLIMAPVDNTSGSDTAKYNQFPSGSIFGQYGIMEAKSGTVNMATYLARTVVNVTNGTTPAYVLFTPSMYAANAAQGYVSPADMNALRTSIEKSRYWKRILNADGTVAYEITPAANDIPQGPYNSYPLFSVP